LTWLNTGGYGPVFPDYGITVTVRKLVGRGSSAGLRAWASSAIAADASD